MVNESLPKQIQRREVNGGRINHNTNPIERCVICHQHTQYRFNTQTRNDLVCMRNDVVRYNFHIMAA